MTCEAPPAERPETGCREGRRGGLAEAYRMVQVSVPAGTAGELPNAARDLPGTRVNPSEGTGVPSDLLL